MKKAKLIGLLGAVSIILAAAIMPAFSTPMSSTSYSIPSLTISSGGHTGLQSTSYKLQDIKGQAVIGSGLSVSYGLGIGGIYGTLAPSEVVSGVGEVVLTDIGRIRNTWIERSGNDVILHWGYDSLGPIAVNIYYSQGVADYPNTASSYSLPLGRFDAATITARHSGVLIEGSQNIYYRIVPDPLVDPNIMSNSNNSITAGKYNASIPAPTAGQAARYVFVSSPLVPHDNVIDNVFGRNLEADSASGYATELWEHDGAGFNKQAFLTSTGWKNTFDPSAGPTFTYRHGAGYFLKTKSNHSTGTAFSDKTLFFLGAVLNNPFASSPGATRYTLVGNPYPLTRPLSELDWPSTGTHADNAYGYADQLWSHIGGFFRDQVFFNGSRNWVILPAPDNLGIANFDLGKGYVYKRSDPLGSYTWTYDPYH